MRTLAIAALVASFAMPAFAQSQNCGLREDVVTALTERFGESVQNRGISEGGLLVEMWGNVDSGSWTALVTTPDSVSCIVASGQGFERVDSPVHPTGLKV